MSEEKRYRPTPETKRILDQAWGYVQSVPYQTTARWVFYRLLQEGTYSQKADYHRLLGILSKARKGFYGHWYPGVLADTTRAPILMERKGYYGLSLRGYGFQDEDEWLKSVKEELNCPLDRWAKQPIYEEIWFEAAAMQGQFIHYANPNIPLLAFHGDVSIPEKWRTAQRLAERCLRLKKPLRIFYYGDLDPKGLTIPDSAWEDISRWAFWIMQVKEPKLDIDEWIPFRWESFVRVGIEKEHVTEFNIPENPERPRTYQWEALTDQQAKLLIEKSNEPLDIEAFAEIEAQEKKIGKRLKKRLK